MSTHILLRRDTAANWVANNPLLADGEQGLEKDTGQLKIGNGTAAWNSLPYWAPGTGTFVPLLQAFKRVCLAGDFTPGGAPTRDANGQITSMPVAYADGSTGVYTVLTKDANNAVLTYSATTTGGPLGTKTATVTVPRDGASNVNGAVTVAVA